MSGPRVSKNPRVLKPGVNTNRPNGASSIATSFHPGDLLSAALHGNRATRRLARRNLKKRLRAEGVL
jgi:hypothetical protein